MGNNETLPQPRMNTLIPMEDKEGSRCFVNSWDVAARQAEGWKVVGDIKQHTSTTKAPVADLDPKKGPKGDGKGAAAAAAGAGAQA